MRREREQEVDERGGERGSKRWMREREQEVDGEREGAGGGWGERERESRRKGKERVRKTLLFTISWNILRSCPISYS